MPLINIIDNRRNQYHFTKINAIVEAAWHDNSCKGADQVPKPPKGNDGPDYEEKEHVSLAYAIGWADTFANPVTLYIYDQDGGIYPLHGAPPHSPTIQPVAA